MRDAVSGGALHRKAVGVGLEKLFALVADAVFVALPHTNAVARKIQLPHTALGDAHHGVSLAIPTVEVATHRNIVGIWRPSAKKHTFPLKVHTHIFVCVKVCALVEQIRRHILLFHEFPSPLKIADVGSISKIHHSILFFVFREQKTKFPIVYFITVLRACQCATRTNYSSYNKKIYYISPARAKKRQKVTVFSSVSTQYL